MNVGIVILYKSGYPLKKNQCHVQSRRKPEEFIQQGQIHSLEDKKSRAELGMLYANRIGYSNMITL